MQNIYLLVLMSLAKKKIVFGGIFHIVTSLVINSSLYWPEGNLRWHHEFVDTWGGISPDIPPHNSMLWSHFQCCLSCIWSNLWPPVNILVFFLYQFLLSFSSACSPWRFPVLFSPVCLHIFCFWNLLWQLLIVGSSESEKSQIDRIYKINLVWQCFVILS